MANIFIFLNPLIPKITRKTCINASQTHLISQVCIKHNYGEIKYEQHWLHLKCRAVLHEARTIPHKQEIEENKR